MRTPEQVYRGHTLHQSHRHHRTMTVVQVEGLLPGREGGGGGGCLGGWGLLLKQVVPEGPPGALLHSARTARLLQGKWGVFVITTANIFVFIYHSRAPQCCTI